MTACLSAECCGRGYLERIIALSYSQDFREVTFTLETRNLLDHGNNFGDRNVRYTERRR
jgi:hypothetical protein